MKPSELLIAAKALIEDPKHWTTGALARDKDGNVTSSQGEEAVCFCSWGAFNKIEQATNDERAAEAASEYLRLAVPDGSRMPAVYNDSHTHEQVMAMWDAAIAAAKVVE
jgi:hypothetical protein